MLKPARSYEEACRTFRWRIPGRYNVAFDVCDRQTMAGADGYRTALIVEAEDGSVERYTFHVLRLLSNRLANVLAAKGVRAGDRVMLAFGASVEAAVALLAVAKMGAVAVPVPIGMVQEPLAWRLADCGAVAAVVDGGFLPRLTAVRALVPALTTIIASGEAEGDGALEMWAAMELASDAFAPAVTSADDPAFVFYPTDAVGKPLGALHGHRALPGNLPPMEFALGFFPQFGDILGGPSEWMSLEGLLWTLLPAWHHGVPVVARKGRFDPEHTLGLMARHGVRAAVLPAWDLAALASAAAGNRHPLPRALAAYGGTVDAAAQEAVQAAFGVSAHEIWGGLETGALAANNGALVELRPGSPGRAAPGITVEAVDEHGRVMRPGERGMLAVAPGNPGAFLGYLGESPPGRLRLPSGWMMTGQLGIRDLDGYLWPQPLPLKEGIVTVAGGRVDLDEVQATLTVHPGITSAAVAMVKGEVKAFVIPAGGDLADVALARELQAWVAAHLGEPAVPRRIEFVTALPLAADGSVMREGLENRPPTLDAPRTDERW